MQWKGNRILVTGGNSGIGRGLAEALRARGNDVIVTGRNADRLEATLAANPGMAGYELDVADERAVSEFASVVTREHPGINVLVNNAGIMLRENLLADSVDMDIAARTIATNLLGPMRMTAALLPHLRTRPQAAIVNVSSGLAFVPRADSPTYSATKAAVHSWTQALRHQLRDTRVSVIEIAPPLVATELTPGQSEWTHAMPLAAFVEEAVELLCREPSAEEILVKRVMPQRTAEQTGNFRKVFALINPS